MKLVFRLAAVFAVFVASMAFFTPVASAADPGIDLNRYCDSQYPGTFVYAALRGSTVMDWKCSVSWHGLFRHDVDLSSADIQNACIKQYGAVVTHTTSATATPTLGVAGSQSRSSRSCFSVYERCERDKSLL